MTKTTITIPAVEMTKEEEQELWHNLEKCSEYGIVDWNTSDGNNEIWFKGEDFYRVIVRPKA